MPKKEIKKNKNLMPKKEIKKNKKSKGGRNRKLIELTTFVSTKPHECSDFINGSICSDKNILKAIVLAFNNENTNIKNTNIENTNIENTNIINPQNESSSSVYSPNNIMTNVGANGISTRVNNIPNYMPNINSSNSNVPPDYGTPSMSSSYASAYSPF